MISPAGRGLGRKTARVASLAGAACAAEGATTDAAGDAVGAACMATGRAAGRIELCGASAQAGPSAGITPRRMTKASPSARTTGLFARFRGWGNAAKIGGVGVLTGLNDAAANGAGSGKIRMQLVTISHADRTLKHEQLFGKAT